MKDTHQDSFTCPVCGQQRQRRTAVSGDLVRPAIATLITRAHPEWTPPQPLCLDCLNRLRADYVEDTLEEERGALSRIESEVVASLHEQETVAADLNADFDRDLTVGQRVADRVAAFGGSWTFIVSFGIVLVIWMAVNSVGLLRRPFDPYPFILLNLVLSCLAAIQAPIIMMSQNRLEAKDRLRADNDYRVNLKAEIEVRQLNEKIDMLLTQQWSRLLEIQRIQLEMMEELTAHRRRAEQG